MKDIVLHLLFLCMIQAFLTPSEGMAQSADQHSKLLLRTGTIVVNNDFNLELPGSQNDRFEGQFFGIIVFQNIPHPAERSELALSGIHLLDYLPNNGYYVAIDQDIDWNAVRTSNILSVLSIPAEHKIHPLLNGSFPEWALNENGGVNLILNLFPVENMDVVIAELAALGATTYYKDVTLERIMVETSSLELNALAELPFISFIEPVDPPSTPENYTGRTLHRSNVLATDMAGGRHYNGTGISVGMHDDGLIGPHIDYEGRIPMQFPSTSNGDHGDHVAGILMGAGNLDPTQKGMAFGADLYVYSSFNSNFDSAVSHLNQYQITIISKSYGNGCNAGYTSLSRKLDQQVRQHPSLVHVFSTGNSGSSDCNYGAGAGWGNITGGHKQGKNVISVGNVNFTDGLSSSSSRGPAKDGRIKPDLCAKGSSVSSTVDDHQYQLKSGTSMACPGVSGGMAQLYEAYAERNNGALPHSELIKGILLNTAQDLGNPGPDFSYGWGRMNLKRAIEVLEQNQYLTGSLNQGDSAVHNIVVPANTDQLKVMVYWLDYEGAANAARALVNNLDMQLTAPNQTTYLPWVLNPTPIAGLLNSNAVRAVDTLNNMEQVTIDNPGMGTYALKINGTSIPQGPQSYVVIYDIIDDGVELTYPIGGEPFVPGTTETIRWDAFSKTGNFTLEYSSNGGSSWSTISSSISGQARYYSWNVPALVSGQVQIRISRGTSTDVSQDLTIMDVPANLQFDWICPDSLQLSWSPVNQATAYEVSRLGTKYMDSVGTSTTNTHIYRGIPALEEGWFSVKALGNNNAEGRRAIAIYKTPGTVGCPLVKDVGVSVIHAPSSGSIASCNVDSEINPSVWIKNFGLQTVSNVPVSYSLNGAAWINEVYADSIAPGDSALHTFSQPIAIFPFLLFKIEAETGLAADSNPSNDYAINRFMVMNSTTVGFPWGNNFETYHRCGTSNNCEQTYCPLGEGMYNDSSIVVDDIDWRVDDEGTNTSATGPSRDHNPGSISGNYVYTEASESCYGRLAQLVSPCLDLNTLDRPKFTFWYHMYGVNMGELHIDLLHKGNWKLDVIPPIVGNQGDFWLKDSIDLSPWDNDTVNIRFRGITGEAFRSDLALDDFRLSSAPDPTIGIDAQDELQYQVYPNPGNGVYHLDILNPGIDELLLTLHDLQGRQLDKRTLRPDRQGQWQSILDYSRLSSGIYVLRIQGGRYAFEEKITRY